MSMQSSKIFQQGNMKPQPDYIGYPIRIFFFFNIFFFFFFLKVLDTALTKDADKKIKKALTRVIVTRADTDMKEIKEEYNSQFGAPLSKKIEDTTNGNYKDFLLTLIARGG